MIKNVEDIKLSINCFLVNILEGDDNLVLDNQEEDDVIVFNRDINWKWNNNTLNIWDKENKIALTVNNVLEDMNFLDRIYIDKLLLTIL